jgi:hypothetical protein
LLHCRSPLAIGAALLGKKHWFLRERVRNGADVIERS